jgi:hypothetical protein
MKKLDEFLVEFSRYSEPAEIFYHASVAEGLTRLGFQVLWIERLSKDRRWQLRLKATLEAKSQIAGQTYRARNLSYGKATKLLAGWLKTELRSILQQLGGGLEIGPIAVTRQRAHFRVAFVWSPGTPGRWRPRACHHPFKGTGMIRAWLKDHRN